jgi:hypothetical protein
MKMISAAICVAMLSVPAIALAADPTTCDNVSIGADVMAKFPNVRSTCQEVKEKDGGIYIRFVGEVVSASNDKATVHVKDRSGKDVSELDLGWAAGQKIKVGGQEMNFSDLRKGDKLDFWVDHNKWGLFSKPGSSSLKILSRKDL